MLRIIKIRVSDYLVEKLVQQGLDRAFILTGGGAMHLNDAFITNNNIKKTFMHHEQALAMAADGYARVRGQPAIINVTSGPGGINALNGVFGAFVDSVPMVVVSGQVRTETIARLSNGSLRQLGDQEADIYSITKSMVKYFAMPTDKFQALRAIDNMIVYLNSGRPGPIWIDIPINIQGAYLSLKDLSSYNANLQLSDMIEWVHPNTIGNEIKSSKLNTNVIKLLTSIKKAKRPLIFLGNGLRISRQIERVLRIISIMKIPTVTGWNAHDLLPNDHECYCGKPGTVGDRAGNFAVRNADVVLVLGCRLNIRQVSYNWKSFAPEAKVFAVDIDKHELNKHTLDIDVKLHYDLELFLTQLELLVQGWKPIPYHQSYLRFSKEALERYPVVISEHYSKTDKINPYAFFNELYKFLSMRDILVLGNGSACVIGFQTAVVKAGMRLFTNSGCASMGYDLPAAIGASLASKGKPSRVTCVTGDGSLMMNLQELATVCYLKLPIKLFILDNGGYHSIEETQQRNFPKNIGGTGPKNGLGFPNFLDIAEAFGIKASQLNTISDVETCLRSKNFLDDKPCVFVVKLDRRQNFEPKLQSKRLADGSMVSPDLHDMAPFLSREELKRNLIND